MHTIIAGGGKTGRKLVELFRGHPKHKITVIDSDPQKCELVSEMFPHVDIVLGNATHPSSLREAMTSNTDAFIAVTGKDHLNLLASKAAKNLGISKIILRVADPEYRDLCELMGLSNVLDPTDSLTAQIVTRLTGIDFSHLIHELHLDMELKEFSVENLPALLNQPANSFSNIMGKDHHPVFISRNDKFYLPGEIDILKEKDSIIAWVRVKRR